MKHLTVSKKIELRRKASVADVRDLLISRLEKTMDIKAISDGDNEGDFSISGTTGSPASMTRYAKLDLNVVISLDKNVARILISGYSRVAFSMIMLYLFLFSIILLVGLLPGFIETDAENSGAMDALFFLILGIFVMVDVNKKLADPKEDLESALEAADTIFG
jgi:hypothetical protein